MIQITPRIIPGFYPDVNDVMEYAGSSPVVGSTSSFQEIKQYINYYADIISKDLKVHSNNIQYQNGISNYVFGEYYEDIDEICIYINNMKNFVNNSIEYINHPWYNTHGNLIRKNMFLYAISHEMKHRQQNHQKRLRTLKTLTFFDNICYGDISFITSVPEYMNLPWELEANEYALKVITKYGIR